MIPKIIHYCWFGEKKISGDLERYIQSWPEFLSGYTIKCWNEDTLPAESDFLKLIIKYKKWALLSDYIRFYALYHEGGIYFDTDIEVVKDLSPLLQEECFVGFQQKSMIKHPLNGAVLGAVPHNEYIKECLNLITRSFYVQLKPLIGPTVVSEVARKMGLSEYGEQHIGKVKILPLEAFYPYHWKETFHPDCVKDNTYCIHHWQYSWKRKKNCMMLYYSAKFKSERFLYMLKKALFGGKVNIE